MNSVLRRKFSVAVSFGQISPQEYISVLEKHKEYIHDIFFSPTESIRYQTRNKIYDFSLSTNEERRAMLQEVLSYAYDNGILCCMTLNAPMVTANEQVEMFKLYQSLFHIDYLTTTMEIASIVRKEGLNIPLVCSYNEAITSKEHLLRVLNSEFFESIVIGGRFLRDIDIFKLIKKRGRNTILMLNTGCCLNCISFCKIREQNYCINLFNKNSKEFGVEKMYAMQSIFPEEIKDYYLPLNIVDTYKLASRPIGAEELERLLSSYILLDSSQFISESERNYHLYGRLTHFVPYYKSFQYKTIMDIKKELWNQ